MVYAYVVGLEKPEKAITVKALTKEAAAALVRLRYPQHNMIYLSKHTIVSTPHWQNMVPAKWQRSSKVKKEATRRTPFILTELLLNLFTKHRHTGIPKPHFTVIENGFMKKAI